MKKLKEILRKGEQGQAMILALILMCLSSLMIPSLMSFMSTSLVASQAEERMMYELYAADCGMVYSLHKLGNTLSPFIQETLPWPINNKTVTVEAQWVEGDVFKIISRAISDATHDTVVESHVKVYLYSNLFDYCITSLGDIEIQPGTVINGDVQYNGVLDNKGTIYGEISNEPVTGWPDGEDLITHYWVESPVLEDTSIDSSAGTAENPILIGPVRTSADLTITGTGVIQLEGTFYIDGNLNIMPDTTIMLNEQTIFAEGDINLQPGTSVGGPGCIIALGDINFQPNMVSEEFLFIMSVNGDIQFQPGNDFYGSIAGNVQVTLQPNCSLNPVEPDDDYNFPMDANSTSTGSYIITYDIN